MLVASATPLYELARLKGCNAVKLLLMSATHRFLILALPLDNRGSYEAALRYDVHYQASYRASY